MGKDTSMLNRQQLVAYRRQERALILGISVLYAGFGCLVCGCLFLTAISGPPKGDASDQLSPVFPPAMAEPLGIAAAAFAFYMVVAIFVAVRLSRAAHRVISRKDLEALMEPPAKATDEPSDHE